MFEIRDVLVAVERSIDVADVPSRRAMMIMLVAVICPTTRNDFVQRSCSCSLSCSRFTPTIRQFASALLSAMAKNRHDVVFICVIAPP